MTNPQLTKNLLEVIRGTARCPEVCPKAQPMLCRQANDAEIGLLADLTGADPSF